jgi:hypothetical protein
LGLQATYVLADVSTGDQLDVHADVFGVQALAQYLMISLFQT